MVVSSITDRDRFTAPVEVYPVEDEAEARGASALRVQGCERKAKVMIGEKFDIIAGLDEGRRRAQTATRKRIAIAGAADGDRLRVAGRAGRSGIAAFLLVGDNDCILDAAESEKIRIDSGPAVRRADILVISRFDEGNVFRAVSARLTTLKSRCRRDGPGISVMTNTLSSSAESEPAPVALASYLHSISNARKSH